MMKVAELGKSCRHLADDFHIGQTQASSILKKKAKLLSRPQTQAVEDVKVVCLELFQTARSQNIPLSCPMVQEKGLEYARQMVHTDIKRRMVGWNRSASDITSSSMLSAGKPPTFPH